MNYRFSWIVLGVSLSVLGCQTAPKYTSVGEVIELGDTKRLRQMLDDDPRRAIAGQPLAIAANHANNVAAVLLIERGANVNACDSLGYSPLYSAAGRGAVSVVRPLLAHGAEVNATNFLGETPLHAAARNGNAPTVRLLLKKGANPHLRNSNGSEKPLHLAASGGHAAAAALLLAAGAQVNSTNSCADTPLHRAAKNGDYETCAVLVAHGADVNRLGYEGATALHIAAGNGQRDLARLLSTKGADINIRDMNQLTALHWAAANAHSGMVRYLLNQGAKLDIWSAAMVGHTKRVRELLAKDSALANASDGWGLTALHRAAGLGHHKIVELLLAAGADINALSKDNSTPLLEAIHAGHPSLAEYLIAKGADVHGNSNWTPLHTAARAGRVDMIQLLLRHGADVNALRGSDTPLLLALDRGHDRAVRVLLDAGADTSALWPKPDTKEQVIIGGNTWQLWQRLQTVKRIAPHAKLPVFSEGNIRNALYSVAWNKRADCAFDILRSGISLDASHKNMLLIAAGQGKQKRIMDWVWRSGFDPNYNNSSLLFFTINCGWRDLLGSLIKHGADLNVTNAVGVSALGYAIGFGIGKSDITDMLLDAGADVNFGYPLAQAASAARPQLVKRLLTLGADVHTADTSGGTALHRAIFRSPDPLTRNLQYRVVQLLLAAGANVQAKDNQGRTALDLAVECGATELATYLQKGPAPRSH